MKKKAEISTSTIIILIILVISAGIVFFLWTQFNWKGEVDKTACHNSVIFRASASVGKIDFAKQLPLNCRTERVCFKNGLFSSCPSLGKSTSDSPIRTISVGSKEEFLNELSEIIYQDNQMLGGGRVNFMPRSITKVTNTHYCLFTSRISLSEESKKKVGTVTYYDLYSYLANKKDNWGNSYLSSLYGVSDLSKVNPLIIDSLKTKYTMDFSQDTAVVVQVITLSNLRGVVTGGAIGLVSFFLGKKVFAIGDALLVAFAGGSYATYQFTSGDPKDVYQYIPASLVPYTALGISELKCDSIETAV